MNLLLAIVLMFLAGAVAFWLAGASVAFLIVTFAHYGPLTALAAFAVTVLAWFVLIRLLCRWIP
jgi:hypothetical protein